MSVVYIKLLVFDILVVYDGGCSMLCMSWSGDVEDVGCLVGFW